MKFCVNCQKNSSHLKFFTLPPVVAVVTIIRYARSESWACTDTLSNHTTSWLEMSGEKSLNELFLEACEDGEEAKVNAAIVLGVDVNTKDATSGWTGLMWAISYRHESIVDILLAHPDIDINGKTNNGWFPLSQAAWHGLTSVVAKLGRIPALRGVNDQGGLFERTPLNLATTQGKESKGAMVGSLL